MGRQPKIVKKVYTSSYWIVEREVELFTWENWTMSMR